LWGGQSWLQAGFSPPLGFEAKFLRLCRTMPSRHEAGEMPANCVTLFSADGGLKAACRHDCLPIAIPVGIIVVRHLLVFRFELSLDRRLGLWECGNLAAFARFPRGGWEEWESCFCFSTLSTAPPFPQPPPGGRLQPWE
jgi:hypothetical protein